MATVRFVPNPALAAELAHSNEMRKAMLDRAQEAASVARATAPVGGEDDPHPGTFRDSIEAAQTDTGAQVLTTDPKGAYKEFGTVDTPAHATLRRAVEAVVGPVR